MTENTDHNVRKTPLDALHRSLGAKMVPFAGYALPLQFEKGIVAEHLHTRAKASLFDASHMGQIVVRGDGVEAALESLMPADIKAMGTGMMRYTVLTDDKGGIIDDLMIVKRGHHVSMVVNASRKSTVLSHLRERLKGRCEVIELTDRALLALQGPAAAEVLSRFAPPSRFLVFMTSEKLTLAGSHSFVTRSGYTGEDGFEIVLRAEDAEDIAHMLLDEPEVEPAGLGARDTLRLEAGLCLYGNDIDEKTTPIEAGLGWTIPKRRREEGGFPGAEIILKQLADGPPRMRVGIRLDGRAPARAGTPIAAADGSPIGAVTSGGFGPTVDGPIAMGYVKAAHAKADTEVKLSVRGKDLTGRIVPLPFVPFRNRAV